MQEKRRQQLAVHFTQFPCLKSPKGCPTEFYFLPKMEGERWEGGMEESGCGTVTCAGLITFCRRFGREKAQDMRLKA